MVVVLVVAFVVVTIVIDNTCFPCQRKLESLPRPS